MKRSGQQAFAFRTWGGRRKGAGRKPKLGRAGLPHTVRPDHAKSHPVHVTMRAARRLPSLRKERVFAEIRAAFTRTARSWFRIIHFSVQADHVHLIAEADDKVSLSRGLTGVAVRLARAVNRVVGRHGKVWSNRYHARALRTPREVRHGIVYVLTNWRKHVSGARGLDACSSASLFDGWKIPPAVGPPEGGTAAHRIAAGQPIRRPESWLARTGWKRHGLIGLNERPKALT
jgi:REP element-mobilizing transposase RayT